MQTNQQRIGNLKFTKEIFKRRILCFFVVFSNSNQALESLNQVLVSIQYVFKSSYQVFFSMFKMELVSARSVFQKRPLQWPTQNPVKHKRCSYLQKQLPPVFSHLLYSKKFHVRVGSECASLFSKLFEIYRIFLTRTHPFYNWLPFPKCF